VRTVRPVRRGLPRGRISENDQIAEVWKALTTDKHVVVQTAPAIRAALGECFDYRRGRWSPARW